MSVKLDNLNYPLFSLELKLANLKIVSVVRVLFFGLNSHDQTKIISEKKGKYHYQYYCYISISEFIGKFKSIS